MEIRLSPVAGVVALSLTAAACAPDAPVGSRPDVVVDTIGDTIVVRTNSGSVWGVDASLRDYHPYGSHRVWTDIAGRTYILHLAMFR